MAELRCRPGDLARVVYSTNPALLGRTVIVERWGEFDRWDVTLLGAPAFGLEFRTGRPVVGNKTAFRDSSLVPLRGDSLQAKQPEREADHA
ncbi:MULTISPECIES: hypothetical protein [Burkholderia]|uniref:hypothetical protein n=1 Tax=Burkholderia TaxID=32008 RepID=UPI00119B1584|nr:MULTISPECIES: hypothetical protein [Burkholderia]MDN7741603.1 hypothetical protein [Burkholderia gladioli]TWC65273.1 hypothetical protein FB600_11434 [Burkholderia sp. SJZ089]TWC97922.1 hypothetical protein FBX98_11434 [Burkholderia sp. SJZ115]TWD01254.1 hypothetical protein FB601_11434 [Burkholderia sp. SJZ091]